MIPNFFRVGCNGDNSIKEEDLGWSDSIKRDAQSDNPETIFRYIVEIVGLNILFYWMKTRLRLRKTRLRCDAFILILIGMEYAR